MFHFVDLIDKKGNIVLNDEIIYSKKTGSALVLEALQKAKGKDIKKLADTLNSNLLTRKVKFPVLEHCAVELFSQIDEGKLILFLDNLTKPKKEGAWVVAGKLLQLRLPNYFSESLDKAEEYIVYGDEWYVCDIIGERVFGHGLLTQTNEVLPVLMQLAQHENKWMVRTVGVAAHYAVKKGLQQPYVENVFKLLLSLANTTEFHTKKGIGWGSKTIAKFHPSLIERYNKEIFENPKVKQWFRTKVNIGLNRYHYAQRNRG